MSCYLPRKYRWLRDFNAHLLAARPALQSRALSEHDALVRDRLYQSGAAPLPAVDRFLRYLDFGN